MDAFNPGSASMAVLMSLLAIRAAVRGESSFYLWAPLAAFNTFLIFEDLF